MSICAKLSVLLLIAASLCGCATPDAVVTKPPTERERLLAEIRELHEKSRIEYSFAMFVEALQDKTLDTSQPRLKWFEGELGDLHADYVATALVVEPALAYHLDGTDGRRRNVTAMRQTLAYARPSMEELPGQRFRLSRIILEEVFGVNDPMLLLEVEQGRYIKRDGTDPSQPGGEKEQP